MTSAPPRRWFAYSLRTLFGVVTVFGGWLGWQLYVIRERDGLRRWIEAQHGQVITLEQRRHDGTVCVEPYPSPEAYAAPIWRRWMGDETIVQIYIPAPAATASQVHAVEVWFPEAEVIDGSKSLELD